MKVFITGGTGFVGSHVTEHFLHREKAEVYALIRDPDRLKWLKGLDVHILPGDLESIPVLPPDLDYVFHIAGATKAVHKAKYYTVNQKGTASLFQALADQGIRPKGVICLSSIAAGGPSRKGRPTAETDPPRPVSHYGHSKLRGEAEALGFARDFPIVILRAGGVYGPRDTDFLSYFKIIGKGWLPVMGGGTKSISLCHVHDLARAFGLCLRTTIESGSVFNIADPEPCSWEELGRLAAELLNVKVKRIRVPYPAVWITAFLSEMISRLTGSSDLISLDKLKEMKPDSWIVDTARASEDLSFAPTIPLRRGLKETLEWYRDRSWL